MRFFQAVLFSGLVAFAIARVAPTEENKPQEGNSLFSLHKENNFHPSQLSNGLGQFGRPNGNRRPKPQGDVSSESDESASEERPRPPWGRPQRPQRPSWFPWPIWRPTWRPITWRPPTTTEAPTDSPTESPTDPTPEPTDAPTEGPTDPTEAPTDAPTEGPTDPTEAPTDAPTEGPTDPTEAPTDAPTEGPTDPTEAPTDAPTEGPTDPTPEPTNAPTEGPTENPRCEVTCGSEDSYLADLADCQKFYQCSNGVPVSQNCPPDLVFSPIENVCVTRNEYQCQETC